MASRADFHVQFLAERGLGLKTIAARARDRDVGIFWVDA